MKKFVFAIMALACFSWNSYGQDVKSLEKKIIGKWVNPYIRIYPERNKTARYFE